MRDQVTKRIETTHDIDLLPVAASQGFREWLEQKGIAVRDAKPEERQNGLLFWVNVKNWISINEPRASGSKHLQTHRRLRPLINDFLMNPLGSAVRRAIHTHAVAMDVAPVERQPVSGRACACAAPCESPKLCGFDPAASGRDKTVLALVEPAPAAHAPLKLSAHLEDLRDDFALHAPLHKMDDETLRDFAIRRWEYAKVMMETRPQ